MPTDRAIYRSVLLVLLLVVAAAPAVGRDAWPGGAAVEGAPGAEDLVVLVARSRPFLYRLVGDAAIPWSEARFEDPVAIVASAKDRCFYVLDHPSRANLPFRVWRVTPDGRASPIHRDKLGAKTFALGLDPAGLVVVGDREGETKRFDADGRFRAVVPEGGPVRHVGAIAAGPDGSLLLGCCYRQDVMKPEEGRYTGGLFRVRDGRPERILENREKGGQPHDTRWRELRSMIVDSGGRLVLCDAGTTSVREESTDTSRERVTKAEIDGGVLVVHPDGRVEDLTFKGGGRRGPIWRPHGVAEWAPGVYLVADPAMPSPTANGTGGLAIVGLDGTRSAPWRFGWRRAPLGVAILRDVGKAAGPVPPRLGISHLVGTYACRSLRGFDRLFGKRVAVMIRDVEGALSAKELGNAIAEFFADSRWTIGPAGTLVFSARGVDPEEDRPEVLRGEVRMEHHAAVFGANYRGRRSAAYCTLSGSLAPAADGGLVGRVSFHVSRGDGKEIHGELDVGLVPVKVPERPAGPAVRVSRTSLPGEFRASAPRAIHRCDWSRMVLEGQPGSPTYGLYKSRQKAPPEQARANLTRLVDGARIVLAPDGSFVLSPKGVDPSENRPDVLHGSWFHEGHVVEVRGKNRSSRITDARTSLLRGTIEVVSPRRHRFRLWLRIEAAQDDVLEAALEVDGERQGAPSPREPERAPPPEKREAKPDTVPGPGPEDRSAEPDLSSPEATVRTLLAAFRARDRETVARCISADCHRRIRGFRDGSVSSRDFEECAAFYGACRSPEREDLGDDAAVILLRHPEGRTGRAVLRREGSVWRVVKIT
jgi:hypothetical protein